MASRSPSFRVLPAREAEGAFLGVQIRAIGEVREIYRQKGLGGISARKVGDGSRHKALEEGHRESKEEADARGRYQTRRRRAPPAEDSTGVGVEASEMGRETKGWDWGTHENACVIPNSSTESAYSILYFSRGASLGPSSFTLVLALRLFILASAPACQQPRSLANQTTLHSHCGFQNAQRPSPKRWNGKSAEEKTVRALASMPEVSVGKGKQPSMKWEHVESSGPLVVGRTGGDNKGKVFV
ncbi:hypothetical protein K438DRAFT_1762208 [Mycena galopus ATCC 62051]|nr:hypothetical protein K438DRAFT_1762208 [Mycena galopus ATCC 62051]